MKLTQPQVERLESFLGRLRSDTYPEPPTPLHTDLTKTMLQQVLNLLKPPPGAKVLDVGCGQGVAMELFL